MPDVGWAEITGRLLLAAALGGAIGLERELHEREAGLRTHLLVSVGAALFTLVSAYAWTDFHFSRSSGISFDPTRIAAQIVTGIGFLGAGAIIRQGLSVRGLTTAATLWVVAAIGMAAGAGYYAAALISTALVLFSLWPLRILAFNLTARVRPHEERLVVDLRPGSSIAGVVEALERAKGSVTSFELGDEADAGARSIELHVEFPGRARAAASRELARLEGVAGVRWSP